MTTSEPAIAARTSQRGQTSRRKYVIAFVALLALAVAGVVVASGSDPNKVAGKIDVNNLPVGPPAPDLSAASGWINSARLTAASLEGKVVLYDFWTYSCVNCVRTIPHVDAWYERYAGDGLAVVGVHSPEFNFEKDHANVRDAVSRLHVEYPVALDDNQAIWSEFGAHYWPSHFIADRHGRLREAGVGEGNYEQTENVIRALLGVAKSAPRAAPVDEGHVGKPPTRQDHLTLETYLGTERGVAGAQPGVVDYPSSGSTVYDLPHLEGKWFGDVQNITSSAAGAAIVMNYRAREVNLVMATATPDGSPVDVRLELDGKPIPPSARTPQTLVDGDGNTFVRVEASDMYRLVLGTSVSRRTLRLVALAPGLEAFAFTFSS